MKYSIITTIKNRNGNIDFYIDSLNKIRYKDFNLILVNDGSTDDVIDYVVSKMNVDYILINLSASVGILMAQVEGLKVANGDFIVFLDSDDVFVPNIFIYLDSVINSYDEVDLIFFENQAYMGGSAIDENIQLNVIDFDNNKSGIIRDFLLYRENHTVKSPVSCSTKCVKRELFNLEFMTKCKGVRFAPDAITSFYPVMMCHKVKYLKNVFYYVQRFEESTSTSHNIFRFPEYEIIFAKFDNELSALNYEYDFNLCNRKRFVHATLDSILMLFQNKDKVEFAKFKKNISLIRNSSYFPVLEENISDREYNFHKKIMFFY